MENRRAIADLAVGACHAGRPLAVAALALTLLAVGIAGVGHPPLPGKLLWSSVALTGVPALYLAARLEIDGHLFARLADAPDEANALTALDEALRALGPRDGATAGRSLAVRARGVFGLLRRLGGVLTAQLALSIAGVWFG